MNKSHRQIVLDQQKKLLESLRKNKESWQDIFSFLMQYKKQFNVLSISEIKKSVQSGILGVIK